jgi:flagellar hook-associated protein 2
MSSVSGINPPPILGLYSNSGMDIEGIIAKLILAESQPLKLLDQQKTKLNNQQTAFTNVKNKVQTLLDKIRVLTKRDIITGKSIFDQIKATSSDSSIATATASGNVAAQTLNLEVKSLPTATRAVSLSGVGQVMTGATQLSDLGITDGSFTLFVNGEAKTINVTTGSGETVQNVLDQIVTQSNGKITGTSITDGRITITYDTGTTTNLSFGATGDSSNFLSKVGLASTTANLTDPITATKAVNLINLNADITTAAANLNTTITAGTFTINGVTFDTTGKTLNQLITEINNNTDVKVSANFNPTTNKLELTSKISGSNYISLADGTSNFLSAMGLISGSNITDSQTLGSNAEFVLNGVTMYSATTTVDETVTGLSGVTLNLLKAQPGSTVQITLEQDSDAVVDAINDVIKAYNEAIDYIDQQLDGQNNGILAGENRLKTLRNQLRTLFASSVPGLSGTAYDSLQSIGITTGAPQSGGSVVVNKHLQLDAEKFKAALQASPDIVEQLFIARNLVDTDPADEGMDGIFTQLEHLLSDKIYKDANGNDAYGALYNGGDSGSGLFYTYFDSVAARIKRLDESIDRAEERLEKKEALLRKQFIAMDQLIGQYQSQSNAIFNLVNQLSAK